MARMNISIPDPLYERLDRLRDRVNASKVCAQALERELDMLENRNVPLGDPEISQLIQRLQGVRDRWYQRGRDDAKQWAVQHATRDELWRVVDEYKRESGGEMAVAILHHEHGPRPWFPQSANLKGRIADWIRHDQPESGQEVGDQQSQRQQVVIRPADQSDGDDEQDDWFESHSHAEHERDAGEAFRGAAPMSDVDEAAYMEGWRDMVADIWKTVSAALKR